MMKKKFAVVGYGGMGSWHVNHALKSDVLELCGIFDIDSKKSALAEERGIKAYSSLDELICDKEIEDEETLNLVEEIKDKTIKIKELRAEMQALKEKNNDEF